mgnify:CR=1 FL=1
MINKQTFEDYELQEDLLRGLYGYGFEAPSPTQVKAIPACLSGNDVVVQAESGTGKTGGFCIPLLQTIDPRNQNCQAIIICPTRDIALQHSEFLRQLSTYMDGIKIIECIGGMMKSYDMVRQIQKGAHIICGTPGRIKDMISQNAFDMRSVRMVVLDEADVLLERDFRYDIQDIMEGSDPDIQLCLFSATMPKEAMEFINGILRPDPTIVLLEKDNLTLDGIKQFYVPLDEEAHKIEVVEDLFNFLEVSQSLIFVNSKMRAMKLEDELIHRKFTVSVITGDMKQEERNNIISEYRTGHSRVLICSDLMARGIDIKGVKLVINFDFPNDRENYIHRIGRCGRYGSKGVAINLITKDETRMMNEVEDFYHTQILELPADIEDLI